MNELRLRVRESYVERQVRERRDLLLAIAWGAGLGILFASAYLWGAVVLPGAFAFAAIAALGPRVLSGE